MEGKLLRPELAAAAGAGARKYFLFAQRDGEGENWERGGGKLVWL